MGKSRKFSSTRRNFLKGAAAASAATLGTGSQVAAASPEPVRRRTAPLQDPRAETTPPAELDVLTTEHCGSDFMVDVFARWTSNMSAPILDPASVRCTNRSSTTAAIRSPNSSPAATKNPRSAWRTATRKLKASRWRFSLTARSDCNTPRWVSTTHTAIACRCSSSSATRSTQRCGGRESNGNTRSRTRHRIVRDFVKWDDTPISLQHFAESAARAYKIAMTPPMEPVLIVADSELQERPISEKDKLRVQRLTRTAPPQGDSGAVAEAAQIARSRAKSGDHRGSSRAHRRRNEISRRTGRSRCRPRSSIRAAG